MLNYIYYTSLFRNFIARRGDQHHSGRLLPSLLERGSIKAAVPIQGKEFIRDHQQGRHGRAAIVATVNNAADSISTPRLPRRW
jgi:hypothetical protein